MKAVRCPIDEVWLFEGAEYLDERGSFVRVLEPDVLALAGMASDIRQVNLSLTRGLGSIRGIHAQQPPNAESKLVRCLEGSVFDVAVDLRRGSPTFLNWFGVELTASNHRQLLIPAGCGHGFQVLSSEARLLYLHSGDYSPQNEFRVRFNDPSIDIDWPLSVGTVSAKDLEVALLSVSFRGIEL